jgi:predicted AlkP superfamily pyrophosphatase or phosphodiesterase
MWPGCSTEFNQLRPTYSVAYSDYVTFDDKVDQVFDWFDLPLEDRPQFVGLYVPQIDQAGHAYGPYANEASIIIIYTKHTPKKPEFCRLTFLL